MREAVPAFASAEEADAWMEEARVLIWQHSEMTQHFQLWTPEDGTTVGYATTRMSNGKFGVVVVEHYDPYVGSPVVWAEYRLRRQAKARAMHEFSKRSPKWASRHDPKGEL